MSEEQRRPHVEVVCLECHFSEIVEKRCGRPANLIIEHGRDTGHKLTTEEVAVE